MLGKQPPLPARVVGAEVPLCFANTEMKSPVLRRMRKKYSDGVVFIQVENHMHATDVLKAEHRIIERVLSCLEKMTDRCALHRKLDGASAKDAVAFFRDFADRCHHAKEESLLFPLLESRGFSRESGPTGVMLQEHEQGRQLIRCLDGAIEGAARGEPITVEHFVSYSRGYVELLRAHIGKEDHCLFPMADNVLKEDDQMSLMKSFERVAHEEICECMHEKYLRVADDLVQRFG